MKVVKLSTESLASPSSSIGAASHCASCGAPLATDQRYCLECGRRATPMSSVLAGGLPLAETHPSTPPTPPTGPAGPPAAAGAQRSNTLTVIAGVGVLLLAMGVGILIGRGSQGKQGTAPAQVISVAGVGSGTGSGASSEASFTSDWASGTKGFTVELQTLPESGTAVSAVESAKSQATAKGAGSVGALKSEEFSSLTAGNYVIYSGVYHKRAEAQNALAGLKKSFPAATVIEVSSGSSSSSSSGSGGSSSSGGAGSSLSHPAPPSVLEGLKSVKGKSYEERSKQLPNVVETG
jgi:hypothetical protein